MIFLPYGQVDVFDDAFIQIDKTGVRMHIPVNLDGLQLILFLTLTNQ
ncbi:hypothetical protein FHW11_002042 [Pantoea agglomerans]|jgi:hypothetical protein|uniref:CRISPR-associated protein Cas1 n=1 Tax=Enterobacter agglomerans TaxID=549 RepID=A0ACC5PNZ2_ENTAG|nr:CRISPR-associated protein Cas1 [Pantoea agglomerans]ERM08601.1 CRISPR-associated protein Cas1 [Pantoea agglomerans Tx10]KAF6675335.1 CRISPR-associated protein Cas1 [Pantoea sp. EKM21T]KAF6679389.1 CRISPR-associated protein Cas1 [Pantoea sp. EKM22T]MBA8864910.1 hypothetical protein [Pantoea agglomerans]